jgi:bifunctional non-homologous end joining protein LigD
VAARRASSGGRSGRRQTAPRSAPDPATPDSLVTSPQKLLWPDEGITKLDLVTYYQTVAPAILPHLRDRPLVMRPYPNGIGGRSYYRQTLPRTAPAWMPRWEHVPMAGAGRNQMPLAQDVAALTWLANQAAIEMHPWLSRIDAPERPDFVVFDLDVMSGDLFPLALRGAPLVRDAVEAQGLRCYAKTTGGDGVHVYVPIRRGPTFEQTRDWARRLAEGLRARQPDLFTTESQIAGRERLVLIDYAQNAMGKTTVCAYGVRPRPGAPVSMPLTWDELVKAHPLDFRITNAPERLAQTGDRWKDALTKKQSLERALERAKA